MELSKETKIAETKIAETKIAPSMELSKKPTLLGRAYRTEMLTHP